jgi:triosephosphate isomerase
MSKKLIVGNWKMNPISGKDAEKIFKGIIRNLPNLKNTEVVACPPFIFSGQLLKIRTNKIKLGAQNAFYEEKGAYTGEVSSEMLVTLGIKYVILGHSERRAMGENDQAVNKKIKAALSAGLTPIVCVGETERDESHQYVGIVKKQIEECLAGIQKNALSKIVLAYEPVWALSTTANRHDFVPSEFLETKIFIKKILSDMFGAKTQLPRIIYGGSARPDNALEFLKDGEADGLLPGRDSLDPKKFTEIVKICEALKK